MRAVMACQDIGELGGGRVGGRLCVGWRLDGGTGGFYGGLWRTYLPWPSPWARSGGQVCGNERGGRRHGMCGGHCCRGSARRLHPALLTAPQIAQGVVECLQHGIVRQRDVGPHCADARSGESFAMSMLALPPVLQRVRGGHSCRAESKLQAHPEKTMTPRAAVHCLCVRTS
jgi:hypothetical protein